MGIHDLHKGLLTHMEVRGVATGFIPQIFRRASSRYPWGVVREIQ
jgi:hypothetical protein